MKTLQDLTPDDIENIVQESSTRCYKTIANERGLSITAVRKLVRFYTRQNEKKEGT